MPGGSRFQKMRGRPSEGTMGEHVGDPRRYVSEPGVAEDVDLVKGIFKSNRESAPARKREMDPVEVVRDYNQRWVFNIPVTSKLVTITPRFIGSTKSLRIDSGIALRKDILIQNMSDQVVWINTRPLVGANDGMPLGANSAAGKYDGASISIDASSDVWWYARAAGGSNNLIVVTETAR